MKCRFCGKEFKDSKVRPARDHLFFHVKSKHWREFNSLMKTLDGQEKPLPHASEPPRRQTKEHRELADAYKEAHPEEERE